MEGSNPPCWTNRDEIETALKIEHPRGYEIFVAANASWFMLQAVGVDSLEVRINEDLMLRYSAYLDFVNQEDILTDIEPFDTAHPNVPRS